MLDKLETHTNLWEQIQPLLLKQKLPQSLLLVGPRYTGLLQFATRLMAVVLCEGEDKPCGQCPSCHWVKQGTHPDITYLRQEGSSAAIKIEKVRDLQVTIYQTPKRGSHRFVVIEPADKMNTSSANALLKILEEPPSHTVFVLIAEQTSSIPPTILSRCQKYSVHLKTHSIVDYLAMGQLLPSDTSRAVLLQQASVLISELCELVLEQVSPCAVAAKWGSYEMDDLLWCLYLVTAQTIRYQLVGLFERSMNTEPVIAFSKLVEPVVLLNQLKKINAMLRKINHNITMNQILELENLLLGYLRGESHVR
jgi:DNA polymerase-3 subunit delta'